MFSSGRGGARDGEGRRRRSDESFNDERRRMGMGRRGYDSADPGYGYVGRSGKRNGAPVSRSEGSVGKRRAQLER